MTHDKIKAAARQRMAETGESYHVARNAVIREHQHAQAHAPRHTANSAAFDVVAAPLVAAAGQVRTELAYLSGIAKMQQQLAAHVAQTTGIAKWAGRLYGRSGADD